MKEKNMGMAFSLAVHLSAVSMLLCFAPAVHHKAARIVSVDFTLIEARPRITEPVRPKQEPRIKKIAADRAKQENMVKKAEPPPQAPARLATAAPTEVQQAGIVSDPLGAMVVRGTAARIAGGGTEGRLSGDIGGTAGAGSGKGSGTGTGQGSGEATLSPGSKDYAYIREEVMKNIKYPERARRAGFEGKTVVSFIVLESGATSEVKVVKGSGYRLLDDSAKEGIAKTLIGRRVPYRVLVILPVVYRLSPSGSGPDDS